MSKLLEAFEREERKFLLKANTNAHKHLRNAAFKLLRSVEIIQQEQCVPEHALATLQKAADRAKETNTALWEHVLKEREWKDSQREG